MVAVTSRYARAFSDVVLDLKLDAGRVNGELEAMVGLFASNPDLRRVWESPAIAAEQKRKLLDAIAAQAGILRPVRNFLAVLIDHNRIVDLEIIVRQFRTELNQRLGIVEAEIASSRQLSEGERQELLAKLSSVTGKQVSAQYKIDPSLLGGATVQVGSTVYDGSVRGQLRKVREMLSAD